MDVNNNNHIDVNIYNLYFNTDLPFEKVRNKVDQELVKTLYTTIRENRMNVDGFIKLVDTD